MIKGKYSVERLSYRVWKVVSPSGNLYFVWVRNNELVCSCPYYEYTKRICKHIRLVKLYLKKERRLCLSE